MSAQPLFLAADVGGTHGLLQLHQADDSGSQLLCEKTYPSQAYTSLKALVDEFLHEEAVRPFADRIAAACFSVAGPVDNQETRLTNLGWQVKAADLAHDVNIARVILINDFTAVGKGIPILQVQDLFTLQTGNPAYVDATRLVVGAGTGLGTCVITRENKQDIVHASEGGHMDLAPVNAVQDALLVDLRQAFGRVSYERAVSGPGLLRIFSHLQDSGAGMASPQMRSAMQRGDPAAAISEFALHKLDPLAVRALDIFIEIYGGFAGSMALATLSRGGVYIAGGIAHKIIARLKEGGFIRAFVDKGRFSDLLRDIPVHVVLNEKVGVMGAAVTALAAARDAL